MVGYSTAGQNISGQFGMPLYGVPSGLPPFTGNYFWVDGTNGSDGNTGGPQDPFKTLTQAQNACLAGNNDVVFMNGTFSPTATFVWSKNNTHLVGLSLTNFSPASIAVASTAATSGAFSPLVSVTATGCIFQNISALSGIAQAATQVCWPKLAAAIPISSAISIRWAMRRPLHKQVTAHLPLLLPIIHSSNVLSAATQSFVQLEPIIAWLRLLDLVLVSSQAAHSQCGAVLLPARSF
jgi:hypothetical protein